MYVPNQIVVHLPTNELVRIADPWEPIFTRQDGSKLECRFDETRHLLKIDENVHIGSNSPRDFETVYVKRGDDFFVQDA